MKALLIISLAAVFFNSTVRAEHAECRLGISGMTQLLGKNINLEASFRDSLFQKGIHLVEVEDLGAGDFIISNLLSEFDSNLKIHLPENKAIYKTKYDILPMCWWMCDMIDSREILSEIRFNQKFTAEKITDNESVTVFTSKFKLRVKAEYEMLAPRGFDFSGSQEKLVKGIAESIPKCKKLRR